MTRAALVIAALAALAPAARAQRVVALAPLSTLGAVDKSAATRQLSTELEQAIAHLPGTTIVPVEQVSAAIAHAKKPALAVCEGDAECLTALGKLVGAQVVVTGEVGGLGESRVVYLGATDVATGKELGSTTLAMGAHDDGGGPTGAIVRLLDPQHYVGTLHFTIDARGARVFVNGSLQRLTPGGDLVLPVGTQAVRVTHPEYHDFVKFVDVAYGQRTEVAVGLHQYPIVEHSVRAKPLNPDHIIYHDPPVWRRWYVTGPAAVAVGFVVGAIVYAATANRVHYDRCTQLGGGGPCSF